MSVPPSKPSGSVVGNREYWNREQSSALSFVEPSLAEVLAPLFSLLTTAERQVIAAEFGIRPRPARERIALCERLGGREYERLLDEALGKCFDYLAAIEPCCDGDELAEVA